MTPGKRGRWRKWLAAAVVLLPVAGVLLYSTLEQGTAECEICIRFDGREVCRTVTAATSEEARRGAVDNACGILTSGVTNTLRCQRTAPSRERCRPAA